MGSNSAPGRYIAVYGASGSGKTTLAREIGERLGLPVVELDAVYHGPNWQDLERDAFRARVAALLDEHASGWVFDGNYNAVRDLVLARADTVVWLRLPFRVVYARLVSRTLRRMVRREELWNGNREEWRMALLSRESMLVWGISNWRRGQRKSAEDLRTMPHSARIVILRSAADVRRWLAALPTRQGCAS